MKLSIRTGDAKEFAKVSGLEDFNKYCSKNLWYGRDDDEAIIDISYLDAEALNKLQEFIVGKYNKGEKPQYNGALQILSVYQKIIAAADKVEITNLRDLAPALKKYIDDNSERKYLFSIGSHEQRLPYIVVGIDYFEATNKSGYVEPAHTDITMKYIYMDEAKTKTIKFGSEDLRVKSSEGHITKKNNKLNVVQLLERKGFLVGTEEMCKYYDEELVIFFDYRDKVGEQFISTGGGRGESRWDESLKAFNTDGVFHKLVVDEPTSRKTDVSDYVSGKFWEVEDDELILRVPIHPYIKVFNLKDHLGYSAHTSLLKPYVYKPELIHKLILPNEVKELVEVLGNGTREGLGDIIAGKAEGIIIGCVGAPGLGKSLTAEIYAEFLKRPLYTVQCSQLGTKPDDLETKLNKVLERASKWKAVLLLDEADVYIRARGNDILQNAIVGVFLRVLEYYRGIIFMTSNVLDLDDAIESRFSAKIIYPRPSIDAAFQIWLDQIENHGWDRNEYLDVIKTMVNENLQLSGRSIRSLIKLATLLARFRKSKLDLGLLRHAAKFAVHENRRREENGYEKKKEILSSSSAS